MKKITLLAIALIAIISSNLFAVTWEPDPNHTNVGFTVKHMLISTVHGKFTQYTASITYDEKNPSSLAMDVTIDPHSISTGVEYRDNDLKSDHFFSADSFPNITFKSKKTEVVSAGKFKVTGDLTIRNITKEVTLDVEGFTEFVKDRKGNSKTGASATGKINRKEFGIMWNALIESGGAVVSDEVKLEIDAELVQKQ